jgi:hypothetical protein
MDLVLCLVVATPFFQATGPARPFTVVNPVLHQYEDGPPLAGSSKFLAGDTVFVSFQLTGFRTNEAAKMHVSAVLEAVDPAALPLLPGDKQQVATEVHPEDKNWAPKIRWSFPVPPWAPTGTYKITVKARDELSGAQASREIPVEVRGRDVTPSSTLTVANFRFLRTEQETRPLNPPVYRPGDPVWARFEMTGFKLGEKNKYSVEYGLSVLRPTGEVLYSEPKAAAEANETFYPKRFVDGMLSLKPTPDIAPGEYTIVLTVRDAVGNQTYENKHAFRIE